MTAINGGRSAKSRMRRPRPSTISFEQPVTTNGLRVFVPAADLPRSDNLQVDGIVRICELLVTTPQGKELTLLEAVSH